jgi:phosphatidylinositol glycan class O
MDGELRKLFAEADEHTIIFAMGDHGMTPGGDHGGETDLEVDAALFVYSKAGFARAPGSGLGLGFGTADGGGAMYQTDIVPTLALALGLPIPYPSIGGALTEVVLPPETAADSATWHSGAAIALGAPAISAPPLQCGAEVACIS